MTAAPRSIANARKASEAKPNALTDRGPATTLSDDDAVQIKELIGEALFAGEGYRKIRARPRGEGAIHTGGKRMLRLVNTGYWLPSRRGRASHGLTAERPRPQSRSTWGNRCYLPGPGPPPFGGWGSRARPPLPASHPETPAPQRLIRTLKEQCLWVRLYEDIAELRQGVRQLIDRLMKPFLCIRNDEFLSCLVEHPEARPHNDAVDLQQTIRLVLGVARFGEADLAGWWYSHGLDQAGTYVLSRAFPRTWRSAALQIDLISAGRRHEDALGGRSTAVHLFSHELPCRRWANAWLAEEKTASTPDPLFETLASWDTESARRTLVEWAGKPTGSEVRGEGLFLGQVGRQELEEQAHEVARKLTAAYLVVEGPFRAPYVDLA